MRNSSQKKNYIQKLKKFLTIIMIFSLVVTSIGFANEKKVYAATNKVLVWSTGINDPGAVPFLTAITNFYKGKGADAVAIQSGHLSKNDITGVNLLVVFMPYQALSESDISYLNEFLLTGGRILFNGEFIPYASTEDNNISAAVAKIGGKFSVRAENHSPECTTITGSCINSASALTKGVNGFFYNWAAKIDYSGSTQVVFYGQDSDKSPLVVDQAVGKGRITLLSDFNCWSDTTTNGTFFENLLLNAKDNQDAVAKGDNPNEGFGGSPISKIISNPATIVPGSTAPFKFQVEYKTAPGSTATFTNDQFDDNDVSVTSSNGTVCTVHKDTSIGAGTGIVSGAGTNDVTVQYSVQAPGGTWDTSDSGNFTIGINNASVQDTDGKQIGGNTSAGGFNVIVKTAPAAVTGITLTDNDSSQGIDGRDFTVGFTDSTDDANVTNYKIYLYKDGEEPADKEAFQALPAGSKIALKTISRTSGNDGTPASLGSAVTTDSKGQPLTSGDYWVVVTTNDGTYESFAKAANKATIKPVIEEVTIVGTAEVGQKLTAVVSPAAVTADFQWKADGENVGTNSSSYTIQTSDIGKKISVIATGIGDYSDIFTSSETSTVTAALPKEFKVAGTVKDSNSIEVSGAAILLTDRNDHSKIYIGATDKDGKYVVAGVPNGSYEITVKKDGATIGTGNVTVNESDVNGGSTDITTGTVPPVINYYKVAGTVKDSNSIEVSGAAILLTDRNDHSKIYIGATDKDGKYVVAGVPNGSYEITVKKDGATIGTGNVTVNESDVNGGSTDITTGTVPPVIKNYSVVGSVKDSNSRAVSGAAILLTDTKDHSKIYTGVTDQNGKYIITEVPDGSYEITVKKDGATIGTGNVTVNESDVDGGSTDITTVSSVIPVPVPSQTQDNQKDKTEEVTVDVKVGNTEDNASLTTLQRVTSEDGKKQDTVIFKQDRVKEAIDKLKEQKTDLARIVIPDQNDEVVQTDVKMPVDSLKTMADGNINVEVDTNNVKIGLPKESIQAAENSLNKDLYFRIVPVKDEEEKEEIIDRAYQQSAVKIAIKDSVMTIVGSPVTIETNMPSSAVDITLPLNGVNIPENPTERAAFLDTLAVYIEHSDGEKVLERGKIVTDKEGKLGITFRITKFSTFTIVKADKLAKSDQCNVITVKSPKKAILKNNKINLSVESSTTKEKIDVKTSDNANWKLYSDAACSKEIKNKQMKLKSGKNTAFIKVTAENGTSEKICEITITKKEKKAVKKVAKAGDKKVIFIATNADFADAYAGRVLADKLDGKVVTFGNNPADIKRTVDYITNNLTKKDRIYIIGLEKAVSKDVDQILKKKGYKNIIRIGGADKYETAQKISDYMHPKKGTAIVLVNGEVKPKNDTAIKKACNNKDYVILYVKTNSLTKYTASAIKKVAPAKVYIVGGKSLISQKVLREIQKKSGIGKDDLVRVSNQ